MKTGTEGSLILLSVISLTPEGCMIAILRDSRPTNKWSGAFSSSIPFLILLKHVTKFDILRLQVCLCWLKNLAYSSTISRASNSVDSLLSVIPLSHRVFRPSTTLDISVSFCHRSDSSMHSSRSGTLYK